MLATATAEETALNRAASPSIDRKYRIASCINSMSSSGGSELNAVRSVEQLKALGHEVHVLTLTADTGGMYDRYLAAGVPVHAFPVSSLVGRSAARQIWRMAKFLRSARVDLVHAHDCYTNFLMPLAARIAGVPSIASKRYIKPFQPQHRYTDRVGFRVAQHVLANSARVATVVTDEDGIASSKISVIPNFVDDEVFSAHERRQEWRNRLGFAPDHLVFGIVARLRQEKNHLILLKAFAAVHREFSTTRLLIVGEGPEAASLKESATTLGIADMVVFTGHVAAAWQTYAAIDVAVLPSDHEGFPNSVVEAMAVGRPVIATRVGGIPDAVQHNVTGLLFPVGEVDALERAMRMMATDEVFRTKAGIMAREVAEHSYRGDQVMAQLERLYDSVCAK